jgi:hypothetical protein
MMPLLPKAKAWFLTDGWIAIISLLLAAHMFGNPFAIYPWLEDKGPSWLGLDVSWMMTLNYALQKSWIWGRDIIYTYGPLGFFSTRIGLGVSKWIFLCFDVFVVVHFFLVFRDSIKESADKVLAVLIVCCMTLLIKPYIGTDLSWLLLFFSYYWMFKIHSNPSYLYFACLLLVLTLMFYIKVNTGLIGIVFFVAQLIILAWYKKISVKKAIFILCAALLLLVSLACFLHVSLPDYIKGSLEIIKGYNDIMYLNESHERLEHNLMIIFWGILGVYVFYGITAVRRKDYVFLFYGIIAVIYAVLLKKQSMLRNDIQHLEEFYSYGPLILLFGNLFFNKTTDNKLPMQITLVISVFALFFIAERTPIDTLVNNRYAAIKIYKEQFNDYDKHVYFNQREKRYIPKRVLDKIGDKSTDIFPWDSEYLLENKLNYTPRPVFQSFSTYTAYLQEANRIFYQQTPPEFVIYDYDAIDGRYPFNEDCSANLFISRNYVLTDTFTSNERWRLFLQKKDSVQGLRLLEYRSEERNIAEEIAIDSASIVKIDVAYNLKGKWISGWSKPPVVTVAFIKQNGEWLTYKTSRELLLAGLMVEGVVANNMDFIQLMNDKSKMEKIIKVKLLVDSSYFDPHMVVKFMK